LLLLSLRCPAVRTDAAKLDVGVRAYFVQLWREVDAAHSAGLS